MSTLQEFEFLRPWWLMVLPPLLALWLYLRRQSSTAGWSRFIERKNIASLLIPAVGPQRPQTRLHTLLTAFFFITSVLALAGPSLSESPNPLAVNRQAMILLFDLSPSMLAQDLKPNRLTQAQLTLIDLLRLRDDGETGLVVFAGDAHRVAPLSDDPATLENLVHTLHPSIMPIPGSQPADAVALALTLFNNAELKRGDIVLITDGIHDSAYPEISELLGADIRLSILSFGTASGTAIADKSGSYLADENGKTVIVSTDNAMLAALAKQHNGLFSVSSEITPTTLQNLTELPKLERNLRTEETDPLRQYDTRHDAGYWLVLLLLPLAAYAFRRQVVWLLVICCLAPIDAHPHDWSRFFLNKDQRALARLQAGEASLAAKLFEDPYWQAMAHYKAGNYSLAVQLLARILDGSSNTPRALNDEDFYNYGNALAMDGQFARAIEAYDQALSLYPQHEDAGINRSIVMDYVESENTPDTAVPRGANQNSEEAQAVPGLQQEQVSGQPSNSQQQQAGGNFGASETLEQQAIQGTEQSADQRQEIATGTNVEKLDASALQNTEYNSSEKAAENSTNDTIETTREGSGTAQINIEQSSSGVLNPYSEQWLQSLEEDPGGYLRRKFRYLAQQRLQQNLNAPPTPMRY